MGLVFAAPYLCDWNKRQKQHHETDMKYWILFTSAGLISDMLLQNENGRYATSQRNN